jgi:hypothetical protein
MTRARRRAILFPLLSVCLPSQPLSTSRFVVSSPEVARVQNLGLGPRFFLTLASRSQARLGCCSSSSPEKVSWFDDFAVPDPDTRG